MQKSLIHPVVGEITLSSTRRSTRISLSVRPTGKVRLSYPLYVSQRRALEFLEQKIDWVVAAQKRYAERATTPSLSKAEIESYVPKQRPLCRKEWPIWPRNTLCTMVG